MIENKKYPPKEPLTKSDIFIIILWILLGLWFVAIPTISSLSNLINNSFKIESDIKDLINVSENYNENVNKSEISLDQKDWIYRYQWSYYWGSESYKYELNYFNTETEDKYENPEENEKLLLSTKEYDWVGELYKFKDSVYFNLKFENWKIVKRNIYDPIKKENLEETDIEEIKKLFDPELKYPTKEINVNGNIRISEYEENIIYKYKLPEWERASTEIINDTDEDILVFKKESIWLSDGKYEAEIIKAHNYPWFGWGYSSKEKTVHFYFKKATTEEKLHYRNANKLSKIEFWKEIKARMDDVYYNDYGSDLYITLVEESINGEDKKETKIVKNWEFIKIPSFRDYLIVTDYEPAPEELSWNNGTKENEEHPAQENPEWISWTIEELQQ